LQSRDIRNLKSRKTNNNTEELKMKNQPKRKSKKLVCPKAGTATSSPVDRTASQSNMNTVNVSLFEDTSTWIPIVCEIRNRRRYKMGRFTLSLA
jgi:hypothetical protein